MKIRMRVGISGTRNGQDWPLRGEVVDFPNAEAVDLLNAGLADPEVAEPETAVPPAKPERRKRS